MGNNKIEINQSFIDDKLRDIGNKLLTNTYKNKWNIHKPTTGYCYIISEAIFHYMPERNFKAYVINFGEGIGTHWFLKEDKEIIDLTGNQFPFEIDYGLAKCIGFLKGGIETTKGYISKRGYLMAKHLGLV